jgi:ADP-dependent NAD(P)H-hydrate dehydratase
VWRHRGGVPGLVTAGSGDVLAGLLAGLLARGTDTLAACLWSVTVHAMAGTILARRDGKLGFLARELSPLFPRLLERYSAR